LIFITIAISGERLAFITFLSSSIIIFFSFLNKKSFVLLSFLIFCIILILYYFNSYFHFRINELYYQIINFSNSGYGRLYQSSYLIFKSNLFFGVGLKNYATVCDHQLIDPLHGVPNIPQFCNTHPHNFYLEIFSESGIVGFLLLFFTFAFFFFSISNKIRKLKSSKFYLDYKGMLFGNILILLIYIWPIKTSGRFFTTWNGSFFWFNLGIILLITKDFIKKN
jgi:O-antigen ligase